MTNVMLALANLRPGINCGPKKGLTTALTIDDVRFDPPLPEGFVPPTQEEVEAEMARISAEPTTIKLAEQSSKAFKAQLAQRVVEARKTKTVSERMDLLEDLVLNYLKE